jgi:hypothetical protein
MSYTFDEQNNVYLLESNLDENDLYDALLSIAKDNDLIEANQASDASHIMSILSNNSVDIEFLPEE